MPRARHVSRSDQTLRTPANNELSEDAEAKPKRRTRKTAAKPEPEAAVGGKAANGDKAASEDADAAETEAKPAAKKTRKKAAKSAGTAKKKTAKKAAKAKAAEQVAAAQKAAAEQVAAAQKAAAEQAAAATCRPGAAAPMTVQQLYRSCQGEPEPSPSPSTTSGCRAGELRSLCLAGSFVAAFCGPDKIII